MGSIFLQLDDQRLAVLERIARRKKATLPRLIEQVVDDFLERMADEELLRSSARVARRTGLQEADAVEIVQKWRTKHHVQRPE